MLGRGGAGVEIWERAKKGEGKGGKEEDGYLRVRIINIFISKWLFSCIHRPTFYAPLRAHCTA